MLCALILYVRGGTYSLTSTPNDRFLRNFFMAGLFTLRVFARNLLRGSRRRNIFHIFIFDDWPEVRTQAFASNKSTHYILDHDDSINSYLILIVCYRKYSATCCVNMWKQVRKLFGFCCCNNTFHIIVFNSNWTHCLLYKENSISTIY